MLFEVTSFNLEIPLTVKSESKEPLPPTVKSEPKEPLPPTSILFVISAELPLIFPSKI
nr:MAG TPA: hypothetical protein [Caudoviricetes sp.]